MDPRLVQNAARKDWQEFRGDLFRQRGYRVAWRLGEAETEIALVALAAAEWAKKQKPVKDELNRAFSARSTNVSTGAIGADTGGKNGVDEFHGRTFWTWDVYLSAII